MRVLKRRTREYPDFEPKVSKRRSLSLVPKKQSMRPEIVESASPSTLAIAQHQKEILKHIKKHPFTKLPNPFITPSPFLIVRPNVMGESYLSEPKIIRYGKSSLEISGRQLFPYDQGVLLALLELRAFHQSNVYMTHEKEICRFMHLKNTPQDSQNAVWKSLERWAGINLKLVQYDKDKEISKKLSTTLLHVLDARHIETSDQIEIVLNIYFTTALEMHRFAYIDTKFRASIRGDIATQIYVFLQRQQCFYNKPHHYECRLETLCKNIEFPIKGYLSLTRQKIKRAFTELKDKAYVSSWELTDKDYLKIHGVQKTKTKKIEGPTIKDDYPDITKSFRNQFIRRWNDGNDNLGIDQENCMVIAAKRYMQEILKDWKRHGVDSMAVHYDRPKLGVKDVFDAIEAHNQGQYEPHAGWLKSDKTINQRIPQYFRYKGRGN